MRICFIPIDNRPVCYNLAKDIVAIDKSIELLIPPRNLLGSLFERSSTYDLLNWLNDIQECDAIILSLDTIAYGGLIPSRRTNESTEKILERISKLKDILKEKNTKVYAFSSIMRISNNNYNDEEKDYWKDYGKKIFQYSYSGGLAKADIPDDIIEDYLATRKRNFEINKLYLEWQKEGLFDTLIFSKDDCAEYGFNVDEARELESLGAYVKTGADEIPLSLLARAINKEIKIYIDFVEPEHKSLISNYEDVSIEQSVLGQLDLCNFKVTNSKKDADVVLLVNNFIEKQGELVMNWETKPFDKDLELPEKPYIIADVRFANGADNKFVENFLEKNDLKNFYGYAAWNTSANTLGSLLACLKVSYRANLFDEKAFKKLQLIRFLDDWAYQANVRAMITEPEDITFRMKPFENRLLNVFNYNLDSKISYVYPWDRKFEIEVLL